MWRVCACVRGRRAGPRQALVAVKALHGLGAEAEQPGRGPGEELALAGDVEGVHQRHGPGLPPALPPRPGRLVLRQAGPSGAQQQLLGRNDYSLITNTGLPDLQECVHCL